MPVGSELSEAREILGLSIEEVAAQTKVKIERLRAIEQMDAASLPSLVYLKGFLRAYAAAVQLDPDDVTKRYLAELPSSFTVPEANAPLLPAAVADLPLKADVEIDDVPDFEWSRPDPAREMGTAGEDDTPRWKHAGTLLPPALLPALRMRTAPYARTALVAVIALATGWVLGATFGATNRSTHATIGVDEATPEIPAGTDAEITNAPETPARATAVASNEANAIGLAAPANDRAADAQQAVDTADRNRTIDLSGAWALTNRLEPARSGGSRSFNRGFRLQLQQHGNRVSGTGQQWMENGRSIPASNRPSIRVEGTVTGRRLELNVSERGSGQSSAGKFVMNVTGAGTMRGRFVSSAANARGMSLARRMEGAGDR